MKLFNRIASATVACDIVSAMQNPPPACVPVENPDFGLVAQNPSQATTVACAGKLTQPECVNDDEYEGGKFICEWRDPQPAQQQPAQQPAQQQPAQQLAQQGGPYSNLNGNIGQHGVDNMFQMFLSSIPQKTALLKLMIGDKKGGESAKNWIVDSRPHKETDEMINLCLQIEAQMKNTPTGRENILHEAIRVGNLQQVNKIMNCHNVVLPTLGRPRGLRSLHSVRREIKDVAQTRIVDFGQVHHATPIMLAVLYGNVDILKALLNDRHAQLSMRGRFPVDEFASGIGSPLLTPLHCALLSRELIQDPDNRRSIVNVLLNKIFDGRDYITTDGARPRLYEDYIMQKLVQAGFSRQLFALGLARRF